LLASVPSSEASNCIQELEQRGYSEARIIGQITEKTEDMPVIQIN